MLPLVESCMTIQKMEKPEKSPAFPLVCPEQADYLTNYCMVLWLLAICRDRRLLFLH